jgi:hypothetical protein
VGLLARRSRTPRTSSASATLITRSVVSRGMVSDSSSCGRDHELILKVPDRSGIRTATACSAGFLKVPQVALQPPEARSARGSMALSSVVTPLSRFALRHAL